MIPITGKNSLAIKDQAGFEKFIGALGMFISAAERGLKQKQAQVAHALATADETDRLRALIDEALESRTLLKTIRDCNPPVERVMLDEQEITNLYRGFKALAIALVATQSDFSASLSATEVVEYQPRGKTPLLVASEARPMSSGERANYSSILRTAEAAMNFPPDPSVVTEVRVTSPKHGPRPIQRPGMI